MLLFNILRTRAKISMRTVIALLTMSAVSTTMVLVIVNMASDQAEEGTISLRFLALMCLSLIGFIWSQHKADTLVSAEVENILHQFRLSLFDKVRTSSPETLETVGKPRFALACMRAALAFSAHKEDAETTFGLANTARRLGAPPEPCMRAEALALTAMGDYQKAHPIWIELITEHPLETQVPGDYAEAAYTAFENSDPQQAMTILTTGMHRYPDDGNFALRAGWVALLTGNTERGYQFLQAGKRIGYPEEKRENALALLTIAAAMNSAYDDATVYFNDLVRLDPAWAELATLDTLEWPDELKSVLGQFMQ